MDAYLAGLEKAKAARPGPLQDPLGGVLLRLPRGHRDRQAPRRASAPTRPRPLKGKAALANARLAYEAYEEVFSSDRWAALDKAQANKQRPLWASTGVKDPAYKDTLYVDELVAPEHGEHDAGGDPGGHRRPRSDHRQHRRGHVRPGARRDRRAVEKLGISYDEVVQLLEDEGVEKFEASWNDLLKSTEAELKRLAPSEG